MLGIGTFPKVCKVYPLTGFEVIDLEFEDLY